MKTNQTKAEFTPFKLYTMKEFEKLTGVSRWTHYKLIEQGLIKPVINMGKGYKFKGDEFTETLLERL